MEKKRLTQRSFSRTYLTIECVLEGHTSFSEILLFVSSAGKEEVTPRSWKAPQGIPTESQTRDLAAYVADLVTSSTVAFCGVQQEAQFK